MEPPYARIVADIRRRIVTGELRAGDRVPSARQITRDWGVAIATATRALAELRQEGLVRPVAGVGTLVQARPAPARPARHGEPAPARIVRTAIEIADDEGLGALSMRRVATELGVATMALYRHVRSRDELVLMMVDAAMAEAPPPAPVPGWRAQLEALGRLQWANYQRHVWLAPAVSMTRPQLVPHGMRHTEYAVRALDGLGLDPGTRAHAAIGFIGYVRGMAASLESEARARQDTGLTGGEWVESQNAAFAAAFATGNYPHLAALAATEVDLSLDSLFEFGLCRLLDGYETLLRRA
ncbi:MAG TPA: TetR/AcrR family transcriptional regulator C-terminal domain-containing protein [Rugosimonospora sp.]|nr:TetR/AcrR family transcriptional regulator C-terminal domain-containing protein [Rugosimonospora sp.]